MPRALSPQEQSTVLARKKPLRPTVYDPATFTSQTVSPDMETWLILAPTQAKQTAASWIKEMLKTQADKDYADLLKQVVDTEISSIETQLSDLTPKTKAFDDWRNDAGIRGFEDVAEVAWLVEELQAGFPPFREEENLKMQQALLRNANDRLQTAALIKSKVPQYASSDTAVAPPTQYDGTSPDDPKPPDVKAENYPEEPKTTMPTALPGGKTPNFVWPLSGTPKSSFWVRSNSFTALYPSGKQHNALDMGKGGLQVLATADAIVTLARDCHDARGIACVLSLGGAYSGWEVRHYHLSSLAVSKGDIVKQGDVIGITGGTGLPKNNPHLHFEVRHNGAPVDPLTILPGSTAALPVAKAVTPKTAEPPGVTTNNTSTTYQSPASTNTEAPVATTGESGTTPVERKDRLSAWASTLGTY